MAELNKAWTQKTQGLAEAKRNYDAVKPYLSLFEALEAPPGARLQGPVRQAAPPRRRVEAPRPEGRPQELLGPPRLAEAHQEALAGGRLAVHVRARREELL